MSKTRASCFITGSKHLETDESTRLAKIVVDSRVDPQTTLTGLVLSSVSRCLEPVMKHSPSFLTYYIKCLLFATVASMFLLPLF